ncbi:MAG: twin-arginine translocase subunit TatB [Magnetococcales bacterium]|nr:twin-arginine translocase subunit TatB [Magnetococcales bacterium]
MFGMGWGEIFIIVIVALVVIGPDKLPEVARGLAKVVRQGRKILNEVQNTIRLDENEATNYYATPPVATQVNPNAVKTDDQLGESFPEPLDSALSRDPVTAASVDETLTQENQSSDHLSEQPASLPENNSPASDTPSSDGDTASSEITTPDPQKAVPDTTNTGSTA